MTEPSDVSVEPPAAEIELPLLTLGEGIPPVVETRGQLDETVAAIREGTGPVALDAERASGYRYSARAYLVQIRRTGSGTALIDPIGFDDLSSLDDAIGDAEWILHAATQDLPCLEEIGLRPRALFDTELAARLLGYPRVGLATLVERLLGYRMRKEHSAADWSKRPLPTPWLEYAALDVEVLVNLRDVLGAELIEAGKADWANQEFAHLLGFQPATRVDPWRRTSGIHRLKGRRALAAVRELWQTRDTIAAARDTTPGRLIPDAAIIAAASTLPTNVRALLDTPGFNGRGARRYGEEWVAAIDRARALPESDLPPATRHSDGPPQPRSWADRDPVAAGRLAVARRLTGELSEDHHVPVENLLTPDSLRRVLWTPPVDGEQTLLEAVRARLAELGARPWQIDLMAPVLTEAIANPEP